MGLTQLTSTPVVTLEEAKAHLRIDGDQDDATLSGFLLAATQFVEVETRTSLGTADFMLTLDAFPSERVIQLPRPPLVNVTLVQFQNADGSQQYLDSSEYLLDIDSRPGRLALPPGKAWPATRAAINAVRIHYTAGREPGDVPQILKLAVLMLTGHFFENREASVTLRIDSVPMAVGSIIDMHRFPEAVG
jgi:uncharacterized phiE125 gp8 family phage protein